MKNYHLTHKEIERIKVRGNIGMGIYLESTQLYNKHDCSSSHVDSFHLRKPSDQNHRPIWECS